MDMIKPVTKYAVTVMRADSVIVELATALGYMRTGRPGPALIDIPDDIQRAEL